MNKNIFIKSSYLLNISNYFIPNLIFLIVLRNISTTYFGRKLFIDEYFFPLGNNYKIKQFILFNKIFNKYIVKMIV